MREKERAAAAQQGATTAFMNDAAKVSNSTDLWKVFAFFRYKVGTTLDCAKETGILRNSITYYVAYLEDIDELQAISRRRDRTTGYLAKHYSADKTLWKHQEQPRQQTLFGKEVWNV